MIKPKKVISELKPYKTDKYKKDWFLKLDSNESVYGISDCVAKAIQNFDIADISLYPCYGELIDKISQKYSYDTEGLLLTNGCDEALSIIMNTYIEIDDELLLFNPAFSMPALYAQIAGAKVKYANYKQKFVFDNSIIKNEINKNTKIVYIASPNNPTGELAPIYEIEPLIGEFQNVLFIIDCTYIKYSENADFREYITLSEKYENVFVVKSFSKDYALAGLRLGVVFSNKNNIIIFFT